MFQQFITFTALVALLSVSSADAAMHMHRSD
jgi:hypothetical protein